MSVPKEKMTSLEGSKKSLGALFEGVFYQQSPPFDYKFKSEERRQLEEEASKIDDKFGYSNVTRSVNFSMDKRGVPLDSHSGDELTKNLKRADSLLEINDLHRAEMAHFMQGRNASGNNYGSCIVGVMAHKTSLVIHQISHGDNDIPEPLGW